MFLQTKICPTEYDVWLQPFHFELKSIIISDISKLCNLIQGRSCTIVTRLLIYR